MVSAHPLLASGQETRQVIGHREPVTRQPDCWFHDLVPRELTIVLVRPPQSGDSAGYAGRQMTHARLVLVDVSVLVQEHVAGRLPRRLLAIVDRYAFPRVGIVHQHENSTTEVTGSWQRHSERKPHGDGGVYGVAAIRENLRACLGREFAL